MKSRLQGISLIYCPNSYSWCHVPSMFDGRSQRKTVSVETAGLKGTNIKKNIILDDIKFIYIEIVSISGFFLLCFAFF